MTHPSVEEVALHLEGVLEPGDEQRVRAHLEQCTECAATAQDLRGVTERLQAAAQPSESAPPIPADVAARIESALGHEASARAAAGTGSEDVPREGGAVGSEAVGDLAERRRRRVLSGGLLAAAAATVVAVGLGQLTQSGGPGTAGSSVVAEQHTGQAGQGARPRDALRGPQAASPRSSADQGRHEASVKPGTKGGGPQSLSDFGLAARLGDVGLIEGVAAAHSPNRAQHDLPRCVRAALGDALGPVASYAVRLPGGGGAGVVVLRPNRAPTVGVLVACTPQPQVLARRGLHP